MYRRYATLAACVLVVAAEILLASQGERRLPFPAHRAIVDLLRPDDRVVIFDDPRIIEFEERFPPTIEEELYELSTLPNVVVFQVSESRSFLTPNGSWIRTRVVAKVEHSFRVWPIPLGERPGELVLGFDNGELEVKGVLIKAGRYSVLTPGSRYLGLLAYDTPTKSWYLGRAFRIDADNKLARLNNWDGTIDWFSGPLEGVALDVVLKRLAEQKPR